ncbi:hypothetical protein OWR29_42360 [Actinoplanes sp. Pm04-4]|uniref:Uncharacterized protein n=1 Tax=Paractinoplanes pyxinae TaxID=2997416 RepID=A0ABT4BDT4_9ACTN|nr:hypothetical protein [Actinoplanes pyxinae]MCY1144684.1 hypothetical protein [Actinoplanes pyxinae]
MRYVGIDYERSDRAPDHRGPRLIVDEDEWAQPSWRYNDFDAIDYGVEIETTADRVFTMTWDSPGWTEGISLRETPMLGFAAAHDADVAIWDVSEYSNWSPYIGRPIDEVTLHYQPSGGTTPLDSGFWCPAITLAVGGSPIHILLGDADPSKETLNYSADNIAVVFPPNNPPSWVKH